MTYAQETRNYGRNSKDLKSVDDIFIYGKIELIWEVALLAQLSMFDKWKRAVVKLIDRGFI